jgi:hypothetical protein
MVSVINIEAQDSLLAYEAASLRNENSGSGTNIYYYVFWLIIVHLFRIFTSIIGTTLSIIRGYFCVY